MVTLQINVKSNRYDASDRIPFGKAVMVSTVNQLILRGLKPFEFPTLISWTRSTSV